MIIIKKLLIKYKSLPSPLKASLCFFICSFLQRGLSVITTPIFTRILTSTDYGMISLYNSWMSIITIFVTLNLTAGVYMRGLVTYEKARNEFISSFEGLNLTLILIWFCIYLFFNTFFNNLFGLNTTLMILMFANIWVSTVFAFWSAEQRVDFKYKPLVLVTLSISFFNSILSILAVIYSDQKVIAKILIPILLELVCYSYMFIKHIKNGKIFFSKQYWKYALTFNIPLLPHYLSTTILNSSDRIMIANLVDLRSSGIYSLAYSISMVSTIFNSSMLSTIEPWLYKKLNSMDYAPIPQVAYASFSLIAGINIILIAFAPEILYFFAPVDYHDAVWVIPPIAMSVFFTFAYTYFAVFEFYYKKTGYIASATVIGALINIVLNYVFINIYGYYAAGYTTLLCYIIFAVMHYYFMSKIDKEILGNKKIYNLKIILIISTIFISIGFLFLFTYTKVSLRYSLLATLIILAFAKRKLILSNLLKIVKARNNEDIK